MLRQGGWAVPLSCEHPALQAWLEQLQAIRAGLCKYVHVGCEPEYAELLDPASCNNQWTPLAIGGTVGLFILVVLGLLIIIFQGLVRWLAFPHVVQSMRMQVNLRLVLRLKFTNMRHDDNSPKRIQHLWSAAAA